MKTMTGLLFVVALWFGWIAIGAPKPELREEPRAAEQDVPSSSVPADMGLDSLDRHLRRLVPFGFSGAALVVQNGERAHAAGYGFADWRSQRVSDARTVFDIGSLSKQFTAAAVLAVEEEGLLAVDDSISEHLPDVPVDKRGMTLRHLLTHTSGLPPFHSFSADGVHGDLREIDREEAERMILERPLDFPPGEGWTYSNSGYTLLAAVVERVAGRPFETVLRDELFEPSGLESTGLYFDPIFERTAVARGYTEDRDRGSPLSWTETEELWGLVGNGGVLSTLEDLERWHRALRNRNGRVLPPDAVDRLFEPRVRVREGLHYGYGWYIEDDPVRGTLVRHGGANDFGFASRWRWHRDRDVLVVVLLNREPPGMDVSLVADAVRPIVEAGILGRTLEGPPEAARLAPAGELHPYTGRYRFEDGEELLVRPVLGSLALEPRTPGLVQHLAFPRASSAKLEKIRRLDRRAREILDGIAQGDYDPVARALADSSRLQSYRDYVTGWWAEHEAAGGGREDVTVVGTVPVWWNPEDDRMATIIRANIGGRSDFFRLHWRDGRIVGLGGGAVRQPATTLFGRTGPDRFVGYHLGVRKPVHLSFQRSVEEGTMIRLETRGPTSIGWRVEEE